MKTQVPEPSPGDKVGDHWTVVQVFRRNRGTSFMLRCACGSLSFRKASALFGSSPLRSCGCKHPGR